MRELRLQLLAAQYIYMCRYKITSCDTMILNFKNNQNCTSKNFRLLKKEYKLLSLYFIKAVNFNQQLLNKFDMYMVRSDYEKLQNYMKL